MEISNGLNQPVSFYNKNTGNSINTVINEDNHIYGSNFFASENILKEEAKLVTRPIKKKRKNKRLNTMDSDYLPDETSNVKVEAESNNFFLEEKPSLWNRFKKSVGHFLSVTPLVNYFFLKEKTKKIQKTVQTLNDISQNVDDLMTATVPYGEESALYTDIAKNLTNAASVLGKAHKEF